MLTWGPIAPNENHLQSWRWRQHVSANRCCHFPEHDSQCEMDASITWPLTFVYCGPARGSTCRCPEGELNVVSLLWYVRQHSEIAACFRKLFHDMLKTARCHIMRCTFDIVCDKHGLWWAVGCCSDVAWPSRDGAKVGTTAAAARAAESKGRQNVVQNKHFK